jgi:hypothetical protein
MPPRKNYTLQFKGKADGLEKSSYRLAALRSLGVIGQSLSN